MPSEKERPGIYFLFDPLTGISEIYVLGWSGKSGWGNVEQAFKLYELVINSKRFLSAKSISNSTVSYCMFTSPRDACESTKDVIIDTDNSQCRSLVVTETVKC